MITRSRMILVTAMALALGISGIALGDAAHQVSTVKGKISPQKLPKSKYKAAALETGVTTLSEGNDPVIPSAPTEQVFIDFDDDIKFDLGKVKVCTASLNNTTTTQALALCKASKISVAGKAKARVPNLPFPNNEVSDIKVTGFRAPNQGGAKGIYLHAYSATLTAANTQVVVGKIVKSPRGGDYGQRLSVLDAPDVGGDEGALTAFSAKIKKGKVIRARCHDRNKRWNFKAKFVYESADHTDTGTDTASSSQKCKVKKPPRRHRRRH